MHTSMVSLPAKQGYLNTTATCRFPRLWKLPVNNSLILPAFGHVITGYTLRQHEYCQQKNADCRNQMKQGDQPDDRLRTLLQDIGHQLFLPDDHRRKHDIYTHTDQNRNLDCELKAGNDVRTHSLPPSAISVRSRMVSTTMWGLGTFSNLMVGTSLAVWRKTPP